MAERPDLHFDQVDVSAAARLRRAALVASPKQAASNHAPRAKCEALRAND